MPADLITLRPSFAYDVHNTFIEIRCSYFDLDQGAGLSRSSSAPALLPPPPETEEVGFSQIESAAATAATVDSQPQSQLLSRPHQDILCPKTPLKLKLSAAPFVPLEAQARPAARGLGEMQGEGTTLIMHNVPYSMTRDRLIEMLDWGGFSGQYDFVYLPIDFSSKNSRGYCFVNLIEPGHAARFFKTFEGFSDWGCRFCQKKCHVQMNRTQGLAANVRRYRNSALMSSSTPDEYKPAVFIGGVRVPFPEPLRCGQWPPAAGINE